MSALRPYRRSEVGVPDHWLEPLLRSDNFGASLRKLTALAGQESGAVFALEATDGVAVLSFLPYDPEARPCGRI